VRILLPPSESKTAGGRGVSLVARRRVGALDEPRGPVLTALAALISSAEPVAVARALCLPPAAVQHALAVNATVTTSPTLPALERYAGIVYDGLSFPDLTPAAQGLAARSVLVFSGLFGVVHGGDPVPDYRVPAKATLPGLGITGSYWRNRLQTVMPNLLGAGLIIDLRSTDYAGMWRPGPADPVADRLITVRVLSPKPDGTLGVISYPSKYHKGKLAAGLLEQVSAGRPFNTVEDVVACWLELGGKDAVVRTAGGRASVDLITASARVVGV
jgi:cytoplasmic iron level regulating protein YaaA (DUF328/UPF0246 family)